MKTHAIKSPIVLAIILWATVGQGRSRGQLTLEKTTSVAVSPTISGAAWNPSITNDGLEMYFTANLGAGWENHWASRDDASHVWRNAGEVEILAENEARDGKATFYPDGLTMIFERQGSSQGNWDLWHTMRSDIDSPWSTPSVYADFDTDVSEGAPDMSTDGLTLYFAESWPNEGTLWQSTRQSLESEWETRAVVPGFENIADANHPAITSDGLTMVYASNASGRNAELWQANRSSYEQPFSNHQKLTSLNTDAMDSFPTFDSDDNLVFVREGWVLVQTGPPLVLPPNDLNGDGRVNSGDIDRMCSLLAKESFRTAFDINSDGVLSELDLTEYLSNVEVEIGDANTDGSVGFDDFLSLSANFGESISWSGGDFDCDGVAGFRDFLMLSHNFEQQTGVANVPEPNASYLGICMFVLALVRHSRTSGNSWKACASAA